MTNKICETDVQSPKMNAVAKAIGIILFFVTLESALITVTLFTNPEFWTSRGLAQYVAYAPFVAFFSFLFSFAIIIEPVEQRDDQGGTR